MENIGNRVKRLLLQVGIDPSISGYEYLELAIAMVYDDRKHLSQVTSAIYPRIAEIHNTSSSRVERCIRHAIEKATEMHGYDMSILLAKPDKGKKQLTNAQFISACAEYLKIEENANA